MSFGKNLSTFLLFMLTASALWAQKVTLKGVVIDEGNEFVYAANVVLYDAEGVMIAGAVTDYSVDEDKEGFFKIQVDPGTYQMQISHVQYSMFKSEIVLVAGEDAEIKVTMLKGSTMDEIVLIDGRFEKKVSQATTSVVTVSPELAENTNAQKVDELVNKVPGVTVVDGQANIRGGSGYSYGAGSRVLLLVDDMPFLQPDAGFPNWRDMPIENLAQIEVLKGAGSALYGSSALNGIIHVRTAYATNEPESKISIYGTGYGTPKRAETAWWKYDSLQGHDTSLMYKPEMLAGRAGYRTPMEAGIQFAHRRQFKEKIYWTVGGNVFYFDSYRAGEYERKFRINSNLEYRLPGKKLADGKRAPSKTKIGINGNFNTGRSSSFFIWGNTYFADIIDTAIYIPLAGTVTESKITRFNFDPYLTTFDKWGGKHRLQSRYYRIDNQNGANQSNGSNLFYGEYQYARTISDTAKIKFFRNLNVVAGAVAQGSFVNAELYGNAKYSIANYAAYAQLEKGFLPETLEDGTKGDNRLLIALGMRAESNTINSPDSILVTPLLGKIVNPEPQSTETKPVFRAGANFKAAKYTNIRASWGQGYRYPTIAERYISTVVGPPGGTGLEIRSNPTLRSETGWSAEIGIMQGLQIPFKDNPDASADEKQRKWQGFVDFSLFWSEYQDMMEFSFKGGDTTQTSPFPLYFQSINVGNTLMRGAEISLIGQGYIGGVKANIMAGYTFLDPKFKDFSSLQQRLSSRPDENILKYRSRHTIKFDLETFFLNDALSFGVSVNHSSAMEAIDVAFENLNAFGVPVAGNPPAAIDFFGIGNYRQEFNQGQFTDLSLRLGYRYSIKKSKADGTKLADEKMAIKFSIVGKNLLNQEYSIRPALAGAPLNVAFRIDFDF